MNNQLIFIYFLVYILFILINIIEHIYFYESKIYTCQLKYSYIFSVILLNVFKYIHYYRVKFYSRRPKYSYSGIGLMAFINHFTKGKKNVNLGTLMNYKKLPELFQHTRIGTEVMDKNPEMCYFIPNTNQGYDAFYFNKYDFPEIVNGKDSSYITFVECKFLSGSTVLDRILKFHEKYSEPKDTMYLNQGARPRHIDILEIGLYTPKDFEKINEVDLFKFIEPSISVVDYSHTYDKLVRNPKNGKLQEGTIINDETFERVKHFHELVVENSDMYWILNSTLLKNNPMFPN